MGLRTEPFEFKVFFGKCKCGYETESYRTVEELQPSLNHGCPNCGNELKQEEDWEAE